MRWPTIEFKDSLPCPHCGKEKVKNFKRKFFIYGENINVYSDSGYGDNDTYADAFYHFHQMVCPKCGFAYIKYVMPLGHTSERNKYGDIVSSGTLDDNFESRNTVVKSLPSYVLEGKAMNKKIPVPCKTIRKTIGDFKFTADGRYVTVNNVEESPEMTTYFTLKGARAIRDFLDKALENAEPKFL